MFIFYFVDARESSLQFMIPVTHKSDGPWEKKIQHPAFSRDFISIGHNFSEYVKICILQATSREIDI